MPELPEVESVRQGLSQLVVGKKIKSVEVLWDRIIHPAGSVPAFKKALQGQKIEGISRRGKFLIFHFSDYDMLSHLRMEGKYRLLSSQEALNKHDHVIFHLEDQEDLRYNDVRKFGRMELLEKGTWQEAASIQKLGPEPTRESFQLPAFRDQLKRRVKNIKGILLDQGLVAGIGNIYADEILFQAKLFPGIPGQELTEDQVKALYQAILDVMDQAVKKGGTTIRTYENAFGENGSFQDQLQVYGREGQACYRCGERIEKIQLAQRGTHFCPHCQASGGNQEWLLG